jgi:hypothetical protein
LYNLCLSIPLSLLQVTRSSNKRQSKINYANTTAIAHTARCNFCILKIK